MNIAVLYNKPAKRFESDGRHMAAEEDTEMSAREVYEALKEKGARATLVAITEETIDATVAGLVAYDLVFNLIEWTGVDTRYAMQTFDRMDGIGIHYTGATKANYQETCDKALMKIALARGGLATAPWQTFETGEEPVSSMVVFPSLIKVASEHSSVGLTTEAIVQNPEELRAVVRARIAQYHQPVIAEAFLSGREFQVTLLEVADELVVFPPAEIVYNKQTDVPLLTYESRWDEEHPDYGNSTVCVPQLDSGLQQELVDMCRKAFVVLGFRDYARFDLRCDASGRPYFLEVNSNPGLGDDGEYGMTLSYRAAGLTFADFIWQIVTAALRRKKSRGLDGKFRE